MKEIIVELVIALVSALIGYLAIGIKKLVDKHLNDNTKRAVAKTVVKAVEQIYKDCNGHDKLTMGITFMSELLEKKGIKVNETEIRLLIEEAVAEFNEVFKKGE